MIKTLSISNKVNGVRFDITLNVDSNKKIENNQIQTSWT